MPKYGDLDLSTNYRSVSLYLHPCHPKRIQVEHVLQVHRPRLSPGGACEHRLLRGRRRPLPRRLQAAHCRHRLLLHPPRRLVLLLRRDEDLARRCRHVLPGHLARGVQRCLHLPRLDVRAARPVARARPLAERDGRRGAGPEQRRPRRFVAGIGRPARAELGRQQIPHSLGLDVLVLVHVRGGGPRRGAQPKVVRAKGAHYLVLGGNALLWHLYCLEGEGI
mmetsp:Transcript_27904/g.70089  ORF Transcript_27904/g.70089 Transcript_27904/m.70089 type:complete len:221 (+) Transcript_27904:142-804(+)